MGGNIRAGGEGARKTVKFRCLSSRKIQFGGHAFHGQESIGALQESGRQSPRFRTLSSDRLYEKPATELYCLIRRGCFNGMVFCGKKGCVLRHPHVYDAKEVDITMLANMLLFDYNC